MNEPVVRRFHWLENQKEKKKAMRCFNCDMNEAVGILPACPQCARQLKRDLGREDWWNDVYIKVLINLHRQCERRWTKIETGLDFAALEQTGVLKQLEPEREIEWHIDGWLREGYTTKAIVKALMKLGYAKSTAYKKVDEARERTCIDKPETRILAARAAAEEAAWCYDNNDVAEDGDELNIGWSVAS